ncbi:MAG TPA: universal stress protein [Thermoleophilaceae bacterium]|nr:universal stress protein [Thermoleophilaceae bacterium]
MSEVIVVGTDGSATAKVAVERAAALAKLMGARIELVSGYRDDRMLVLSAEMYRGEMADEARRVADECLADAAEQLRSDGLEVETHCMRGDPAAALIHVAESTDASMIVVGSKGMNESRRFLLGSVPNRVSHHAPCSVMIVRTA